MPLQLAWSLSGKRGPLVQRGDFAQAMSLADNLVRWAPRNGTHRIHQGFIAYLTGNKERHPPRSVERWSSTPRVTRWRWTARCRRRPRLHIGR